MVSLTGSPAGSWMPPDERRVRQTSQTVFVATGQLPVRHRAAAVTMDGARPGGLSALRHKVSSRRSPCAESGVGCNDPLQREAAGAGVACEGLLLLGTGASRLRIVARFMARGSGRPGGDSSGRMWLAVVAWGGVRVVRNDPMGGGPGGWAGAGEGSPERHGCALRIAPHCREIFGAWFGWAGGDLSGRARWRLRCDAECR